MNLYDQVWLELPSNDHDDWIACSLDMGHDWMNLVLKIGLVAIVVRDLGLKSIWGDLDWVFSFFYTLRHEQTSRSKFSHIVGF